MTRPTVLAVAALAALLPSEAVRTQARRFALEAADGVRPHNVAVQPAVLDGRKGLRVVTPPDVLQRFQKLTPEEQAAFEQLAVLDAVEFGDGVIRAEIAGDLAPDAGPAARGFVGIAFRLQPDMRTYDAFYLRPTNGRADDQERRNRSAQYISHPQWPWFRLRKETPGRYESYVDLRPGAWTKVRIEVRGDKARLYVHEQDQPTLIVNDVKSGAQARGSVALWLGPGTVAHFRELTVEPLPAR